MEDFLDSFIEIEDPTVKKKHRKKEGIKNPILYSQGEQNISIIVDTPLSVNQLYIFNGFLQKCGIYNNYQIIYPLKFKPITSDENTQVVKFYTENKFDLSEIIPVYSKIITFGRALFSITESNDLNVEGFKDTLLWKTSFYTPEYKCQVFPLGSFTETIFKDNPEQRFAKIQIDLARKFVIKKSRKEKTNRVYINSKEETNSFLKEHTGRNVLMAWDIETKGLNPWADDGRILIFTCSFDGMTGYRLKWKNVDIELFNKFMKGKRGILANGKFDFRWVAIKGVEIKNLYLHHDTINASHVINELQFNGLKSDSYIYTKNGGYDRELDRYAEKYPACKKDYSLFPKKMLDEYGTDDAIQTFKIYKEQLEVIAELDEKYPLDNGWSVSRYLNEIVFPSINMYFGIEMKGLRINKEELKKISDITKENIFNIKNEIYKAFNISEEDVNLNSGEQLGKFIESLGWNIQAYSKKGIPLTNITYLERWKEEGHSEADLLIKLRQEQALFKTFIGVENELDSEYNDVNFFINDSLEESDHDPEGFYQYIEKHDDGTYRVHCNFGVMLADSHRMKHKSPNLANIPSHGDKAELVRRIFAPLRKDDILSSTDYSGLQLRILAMLSGDTAMKEAFTSENSDLHSITGQSIFTPEISLDEFLKHKKDKYEGYRFKSKGINFSLSFNTSAFSFAQKGLFDEWDDDDLNSYIAKNDLQKKVQTLYNMIIDPSDEMKSMFNSFTDKEKFAKCWACASFIKKKFFEKYYGLEKFIHTSIEFATENGYSRSYHGAFRRLWYIHLGKDCKDINKSIVKNNQNISVNSPVQNFEVVIVHRSMLKIQDYINTNNLNSFMFGSVHDAIEGNYAKDELTTIIPIVKTFCEKDYPEYHGIPLEVEGNVAYYWDTINTDTHQLWDGVFAEDMENYL